jgi:hypothetical protein
MESFEDATERNKVQLQLIVRRDDSHLPGVVRYVKPLRLVALDLLAAFVVELKVAFAGFRIIGNLVDGPTPTVTPRECWVSQKVLCCES